MAGNGKAVRLDPRAGNRSANDAARRTPCKASDQRQVDFQPGAVRFIKLGQNGKWATEALEHGTIPFGYASVDHEVCLGEKWDEVRRQLASMGRSASGVSHGLREIKEFYGLPPDTLWVTAANGHFWWAFAQGPVVASELGNSDGPARYRRTRGGWSNLSLAAEPLTVRSLGSAITRTASYRMTICTIGNADHLVRRIRGERSALHATAISLQKDLRILGLQMIQQLDFRDFETLVDLIFARGGWQRRSVLGEGQPDVDLILTHPTISETAWVQVKSRSSQAELDDYLNRYRQDGSCDRFFYVVHSAAASLSVPSEPTLHLWAGDRLAAAAIDAGLFDWLVDRTG